MPILNHSGIALRTLFLLVVSAAIVAPCSHARAAVRFVRASATGTNTGSSWANAHMQLHTALALAQPGDEVWVAMSTYSVPDDAGFIAPQGVSLYGGFEGNETSRGQRNPAARTRLTGFHPIRGVVVLTLNNPTPGTIIDGFRFDGTLTSQPHAGGGMIVNGGTVAVSHCLFIDNIAGLAAGVFAQNARTTFTDCVFDDNWSQVGDGGGIAAIGVGSLTVTRCQFLHNFCRELYGVVGRGGGIFNGEGSVLRVKDCLFDDNWAYNLGHEFVTIGGGIANLSSNAIVENCIFINNEASLGGGIGSTAPMSIINCVFTGNLASEPASVTPFDTGRGGAIYGQEGIDLTVKNCTIAANWSKHTAGGVWMDGTIENSILWYNVSLVEPGDTPETTADQQSQGSIEFRFCDVAGIGAPSPQFPGTIQSVPQFVVAPMLTNTGVFTPGDLHTRATSPCVDSGDNSVLPAGITTDLEGFARYADEPLAPNVGIGASPIVDMGAYERQAPTAACDSIDFNNDGVSPDSADIADFLSVFGGGPCSTGTCNDIDFNNDGVSPDSDDIAALIAVFAGGAC